MEPATTITPPEGPQQDQVPDGLTRPLSWLWLLPFFAVMLSGFVPLVRPWQENDLDWGVILQRFYLSGAQFGIDVGFTYGPWGFIWAAYDPRTFPVSCLCWIALALVSALAIARIFSSVPSHSWARAAGLLAAAIPLGGNHTLAPDIRLMMLPLLFLLYHFLVQPARNDAVKLLLAPALGLVGLIKFTYFVAAVVVISAITLDLAVQRFRWRRPIPIHALTPAVMFLAAFAIFWLAAGQHWSNFSLWVRSSTEITKGYSEVMGIRSVREYPQLARTLLASAAIFSTAVLVAFGRLSRLRATLFTATFLPLLILLFRAGFVRHDYHELITNGILLALAPPLCWLAWHAAAPNWLRRSLCIVTAATTLCAASFSYQFAGLAMARQFAQILCVDVSDEAFELVRLAAGRPLRQRELWEQRWKEIAAAGNWPHFVGTVEQFPDFSPELIASTAEHVARPTLKSVAAHTPYLSEMNAAKISGPGAVRNLLIKVGIFEQRMPTMDDCRSWPAILKGYDLLQDTGQNLHLIKRPQDRALTFTPILSRSAKLNEQVVISAPSASGGDGKRLLWAKIQFDRRPLGQLVAGIYRAPPIYLNIKTVGGSRHVFRIVALNASDGFILGPIIERNETIRSILTASPDQADLDALMPTSISIEGRYGGDPSWYFGDTFQITVEQMILE